MEVRKIIQDCIYNFHKPPKKLYANRGGNDDYGEEVPMNRSTSLFSATKASKKEPAADKQS